MTSKDNNLSELEQELHAMFYRAMLEWRDQGRSEEAMYAINNFNTGVGIKLRKDIAKLFNNRLQHLLDNGVEDLIEYSGDQKYDSQGLPSTDYFYAKGHDRANKLWRTKIRDIL